MFAGCVLNAQNIKERKESKMTNTKTTKRALLFSCISMLLCVSMLVGTTFAWFTDTATTGVNTIVAGNLDIALEYSANYSDWKDAEEATDIFSSTKWEPGRVEVVYFKVINKGTLAVEFKVGTNVILNKTGKNAKGEEIDLAKVLQFGIVEVSAAFADRQKAVDAIETPNEFSNIATGEMVLETKGEEKTFAMVVWMPTTIGNDANHDGKNVPEIQFGVNVLATQRNVENDSYGADYDENATYPNGPKLDAIVAAPKTAAEFKDILDTAFTGGSASGTITINLENDFDFNNEWTTAVSANYSGVNTVVINGNGHYIKNMNAPLIEGVFGGSGTLTFNDLTIKESTISAAGGADVGIGVFMNNSDTSTAVTFNNCHIENVNITNTADDSTLGGFVGYCSAATLNFTNCSVRNSKFTGTKDIGALVGYTQSAVTATGITVTGNTITSSNTSTYRVGSLAGTFNVNASTITTTNVSNNTVTQTNAADMSKKTSEYAGRIYADVTVDGTALTKN